MKEKPAVKLTEPARLNVQEERGERERRRVATQRILDDAMFSASLDGWVSDPWESRDVWWRLREVMQ